MRNLPYPGHSWSLTQHAIGNRPDTLYQFLACAALYENESRNVSADINRTMNEQGLLTSNIRDGSYDAWRDYQQILAELGLIYSTKICRSLRITEAGHMYLAGQIGYSELIGVQALRYQYPNGQKTTIQSRLRTELRSENYDTPETLTELQAREGMLIKPGTLLLRLLSELFLTTGSDRLSVDECLAFVLPCRRNGEWPLCLSEILSCRATRQDLTSINEHGRRNVQDWFSLLNNTDLFKRQGSYLHLTDYAKTPEGVANIAAILTAEEDPTSFWIPVAFNRESRISWFDWFGHIPLGPQEIAAHPLDETFVAQNYVAGPDEDDFPFAPDTRTAMNLTPVNLAALTQNRVFRPTDRLDQAMLNRINEGAFRRHSKTLLHNRMVATLAQKLLPTGATLTEDPCSIDLLATWPDGEEAIFEVKTVTARSLPGRLRTAIGQVEEYAYRRFVSTDVRAEKVIVINAELAGDAWQVDFLNNTMHIGLLCTTNDGNYRGFAPDSSRTGARWSR